MLYLSQAGSSSSSITSSLQLGTIKGSVVSPTSFHLHYFFCLPFLFFLLGRASSSSLSSADFLFPWLLLNCLYSLSTEGTGTFLRGRNVISKSKIKEYSQENPIYYTCRMFLNRNKTIF